MLLCDPGVTDTADIRNVTQIYFTRQKGTLPLSSFIHFWIFLKQLVLSVMYQVQIISTCWLCPTQHKVKSAEGLLIQRAYVEVSIASLGLLLWAAPWALFFTWAHRESPWCAEDLVHMLPAMFHHVPSDRSTLKDCTVCWK